MLTDIISNVNVVEIFSDLKVLGLGLAMTIPSGNYSLLHQDPTTTPPTRPLVCPASTARAIVHVQMDGKPFLERLREHLDYLKGVSTLGPNPPITRETAALALRAWWEVWEATGFALPIPAACTGPDGQMLYVWDREQHHLELEIIPGQPAEFFYRNRNSGDLWGEDYDIGEVLPAGAVEKLKLFI